MAKTTHGHCNGRTETHTYRIWRGMVSRCRGDHPYYGGKGVKVCDQWHNFEAFLEDVGEIPEGMTLDRINSEGNYEPGNVQLATMKQQARNRSTNRYLTIGGVAKTLTEWAEENGIPVSTLQNRLKLGWPEDRLLIPSRSSMFVMLTVDGRTQPLSDWAREKGIAKALLTKRIKAGWPPERCLDPPRDYPRRAKPPQPHLEDRGASLRTHGHAGRGTRTYRLWKSMVSRCRIGHTGYEGVTVCERWMSFENFLADIGEIPDGMTIDRIDSSGNYGPENVRVATSKEQSRNLRSNRILTIGGVSKCVAEWAEEKGVPYSTLIQRVRRGCPEEKLFWPPNKGRRLR